MSTHTITRTTIVDNSAGSIETIVNTLSAVGNKQQKVKIDLPGGTAATALGVKIDISQLKAIMMWYSASDTTIVDPVVVETNGTGGGAADTFNVTRTVPVIWYNDGIIANPFSVDVTELYVTPPSTVGEDGTFNLILIEAAPDIT